MAKRRKGSPEPANEQVAKWCIGIGSLIALCCCFRGEIKLALVCLGIFSLSALLGWAGVRVK